MTTNKNIERYLWIISVLFITYLFLGSFIVSGNFLDLGYLVILYLFIGIIKLVSKNK